MRRIWNAYRGLRGRWQVTIAALLALTIIGLAAPKEPADNAPVRVASNVGDHLSSASTTAPPREVTMTIEERTTTTVAPTTTSAPTTIVAPTTTTAPPPPPPTTAAPAPQQFASSNQCDPNYSGACVPIASDVDCAGGSGNGPSYVDGPVQVVGSDIYDLDRDGDGVGCQS